MTPLASFLLSVGPVSHLTLLRKQIPVVLFFMVLPASHLRGLPGVLSYNAAGVIPADKSVISRYSKHYFDDFFLFMRQAHPIHS
jgi:hypothetical protein